MKTARIGTTLLSFCLTLLAQGCAMEGVRHVTILDDHSAPLNGILVVPLYGSSAGVGVGAEGAGPHSATKLLVERPFMFNSGEDLMAKQIQTRGVVIPFPLPPWCFFIGRSHTVASWLCLKKEYGARALDRSDIFGESPIVMTNVDQNEVREAVDILLRPNADQKALKQLFKVEWMNGDIQLSLDAADRDLLNAQSEHNPNNTSDGIRQPADGAPKSSR